jgi:hypothetical protein
MENMEDMGIVFPPEKQKKSIEIIGKTGAVGEPWSTASYITCIPKNPNGKTVRGGDIIDLSVNRAYKRR